MIAVNPCSIEKFSLKYTFLKTRFIKLDLLYQVMLSSSATSWNVSQFVPDKKNTLVKSLMKHNISLKTKIIFVMSLSCLCQMQLLRLVYLPKYTNDASQNGVSWKSFKIMYLIVLLKKLYKNKSMLEKKINMYWSLFQSRLVHFEKHWSVP